MSGISSQGLRVSRETSPGSGTFTPIAQIKSHDGPSSENPEIDVTDLDALAKQFIPGLVDNGEVSVELNFNPLHATHQQIRTDRKNRTVANWRITFPTTPNVHWTFPAFPKSFTTGSGVDAALTGSLTLRVAGDDTETTS